MFSIELQSLLWTCDIPIVHHHTLLRRGTLGNFEEAVRCWDKFITLWKSHKKTFFHNRSGHFLKKMTPLIHAPMQYAHFLITSSQDNRTEFFFFTMSNYTDILLYFCFDLWNKSYPAASPVPDYRQWWRWQWPIEVCWSPPPEPIGWDLPTTELHWYTLLQVKNRPKCPHW